MPKQEGTMLFFGFRFSLLIMENWVFREKKRSLRLKWRDRSPLPAEHKQWPVLGISFPIPKPKEKSRRCLICQPLRGNTEWEQFVDSNSCRTNFSFCRLSFIASHQRKWLFQLLKFLIKWRLSFSYLQSSLFFSLSFPFRILLISLPLLPTNLSPATLLGWLTPRYRLQPLIPPLYI